MEKQNDQATTAVATIDPAQVSITLGTFNDILSRNQLSIKGAKDAGKLLLDTIEAEGMTPEIDAACNDYLVKCKTTLEAMQQRRKPLTQILDLVKKEFTRQEAQLDPAKTGNIYQIIQAHRNSYAAEIAKQQREKEAAAQRALSIEREKARLKADAELALSNFFNAYLTSCIDKLQAKFNAITLANYEQMRAEIGGFSDSYSHDHFDSFAPALSTSFTSKEDLALIITDCRKGKFGIFADTFRTKILDTKLNLVDRIPSRKAELEEIAQAEKDNAAKAAQLKADAEARQKADADRLAQEELDRKAKAEQSSESTRQLHMTDAMFTASTEIASAPQQTAAIRESYEIQVKHPLGYFVLAQFFFERDGKNETLAKLEKKTLGALRKYAADVAFKQGEKIESPWIHYEPVVKALAQK